MCGAQQAQLKGLFSPAAIDARSANPLVLFEQGVFLMLDKASKPSPHHGTPTILSTISRFV